MSKVDEDVYLACNPKTEHFKEENRIDRDRYLTLLEMIKSLESVEVHQHSGLDGYHIYRKAIINGKACYLHNWGNKSFYYVEESV